ncbi:MAG TPA: UDP-N-acetylmuramoyl-L-alanyl-D-glutamate--2,6-diaminopimelate ligase [Candidatus Eisenbacteria bacterium]
MTLRELLHDVPATAVRGPLDLEVEGLAYDSRRVEPGDLFFALAGLKQDGRTFSRRALEAGAVAVVGPELDPSSTTAVQVADPRRALAEAALRFHRQPARELRVVAVTGTNGKTTTTYLLESIFRAAGWSAGLIGTTGVHLAGQIRPAALTTPEAPELQALLRQMVEQGVRAVALELSSHALVQHRGYGLDADVAVFTNLSHDHLDYHGTLEAYLDAKLMLFDGRNRGPAVKPWTAVVNGDDPAAPRVVEAAKGASAVWSFGRLRGVRFRIAWVRARRSDIALRIEHPDGGIDLEVSLLGSHNAWNAAGAFAAARALGISDSVIARGLKAVDGVPGRLEPVEAGQPFTVVVDYAHTPDALARVLAAAREHAGGRVLLVFGCGGDRDRTKRPEMGRVAAAGSDRAWVTSDNPRGEDPAAIAAEILAGGGPGLRLELDRRRGIAECLEAARPGDIVVIAGKGHETTQTIGERVLPFDDRAVARELLASRGTRHP